jgi:hypothetical protein
MSSSAVRTEVKNYLQANWTETPIYDLSDFYSLEDLPSDLESWLGIQFIGGLEEVRAIGETCYRERGIIFFHVVVQSGFDSANALSLCENLRDLMRALRVNSLVIEQVKPPNDSFGKALFFKGNWHGWAVETEYYYDFDY